MAGNGVSLREQLDDFLNEQLNQIVISNPRDKEDAQKIKVRPLYLRLPAGKRAGSAAPAADESLAFQAEEFRGKQAFHRNMRKEETLAYIEEAMQKYKQMELQSELGSMQVLVSKRLEEKNEIQKRSGWLERIISQPVSLTHNCRKCGRSPTTAASATSWKKAARCRFLRIWVS